MAYAANSVVMARSENMTCIHIFIIFYTCKSYKAVVSCNGNIGILLWPYYVVMIMLICGGYSRQF